MDVLSADEDQTFAFAVTADSKVVGSIGVFRQENIHRQTGELGYYIAEEYWGKGIMTEAVKQICAYVFDKSDMIRIYAEPFAYNAASCRVLEKAGFQYEGTLRNNAEMCIRDSSFRRGTGSSADFPTESLQQRPERKADL